MPTRKPPTRSPFADVHRADIPVMRDPQTSTGSESHPSHTGPGWTVPVAVGFTVVMGASYVLVPSFAFLLSAAASAWTCGHWIGHHGARHLTLLRGWHEPLLIVAVLIMIGVGDWLRDDPGSSSNVLGLIVGAQSLLAWVAWARAQRWRMRTDPHAQSPLIETIPAP